MELPGLFLLPEALTTLGQPTRENTAFTAGKCPQPSIEPSFQAPVNTGSINREKKKEVALGDACLQINRLQKSSRLLKMPTKLLHRSTHRSSPCVVTTFPRVCTCDISNLVVRRRLQVPVLSSEHVHSENLCSFNIQCNVRTK